ncbi:hypothetical protein DFS33DRAFT_1277333 [Desarmillaria ectypa]|nr:hypothetical protein DFS33DRAFT_1277333 [Desarmillaria ectypa]
MKHIHLKISFCVRSDRYRPLYRGQLIRTRLSIGLDKAAALSILPVDWRIAASDAPDIDEEIFLMGITHDMVQWCWEFGDMYGWHSCGLAIRGSTYGGISGPFFPGIYEDLHWAFPPYIGSESRVVKHLSSRPVVLGR